MVILSNLTNIIYYYGSSIPTNQNIITNISLLDNSMFKQNTSQLLLLRYTDNNITENILKGINSLDALFIADGHHRSAAASKVKASRQKANQNHNGNENYNYFFFSKLKFFSINNFQLLFFYSLFLF